MPVDELWVLAGLGVPLSDESRVHSQLVLRRAPGRGRLNQPTASVTAAVLDLVARARALTTARKFEH